MANWICRSVSPIVGAGMMLVLVPHFHCTAQDGAARLPRARRPDWKTTRTDVDFPSFDEVTNWLKTLDENPAPGKLDPGTPSAPPDDEGSRFAWNRVVAAQTLESEVKSQMERLNKSMANATSFASGGVKDTRRTFTWLSILFAVVNEYPEEIRWKKIAPAACNRFFSIARQMRGGNANEFALAKEGRQLLTDYLNGSESSQNSVPQPDWSKLLVRTVLMQRLDELSQHDMDEMLSSPSKLQKRRDALWSSVELTRMIAALLERPDGEGGDDADYITLAHTFRDNVHLLANAIETSDLAAIVEAKQTMTQSCHACHDVYR